MGAGGLVSGLASSRYQERESQTQYPEQAVLFYSFSTRSSVSRAGFSEAVSPSLDSTFSYRYI